MNTLEDAFKHNRALVFGIGGSGDIVGSIPTARLLQLHGIDVLIGGVTWEPVPYDTKSGPRSFDEIQNLEAISETVGLANPDTHTDDGLVFKESLVSRYYGRDVVLIDISKGVRSMINGINVACANLDVDLIIGVDVGGDVLARGNEDGIRSPVSDSFGLITLDEIQIDSCLGMFGFGSDGELTLEEVRAGIERSAKRDGLLGAWGLTKSVRREMEKILQYVETEASQLPVEAARGASGLKEIRNGEATVQLTPPSTVTFYFDPATVVDSSEIASIVHGTKTLDEATKALTEKGYTTEFEVGRKRLESLS